MRGANFIWSMNTKKLGGSFWLKYPAYYFTGPIDNGLVGIFDDTFNAS